MTVYCYEKVGGLSRRVSRRIGNLPRSGPDRTVPLVFHPRAGRRRLREPKGAFTVVSGKQGEIDSRELGGSVEAIRVEAQFFGDFRGSVLHHSRQRAGAGDIALRLAQRHDIYVLRRATAKSLHQKGATTTDHQPHWLGRYFGEKLPEEV